MIYRRCGCRDGDGRQYGLLPVSKQPTPQQLERACPKALADRRKPKHGKFGYYLNLGVKGEGKRRQVYVTKFATRREAEDAFAAAKGEVVAKTYVAPSKQRLGEYLDEWLPVKASTGRGLKPTTRADYARYIDTWVKPHRLGSMRLTDIEPSDVQRFLTDMDREGRGKVAQARCLAVLQSAFSTARRSRVVALDPTTGVEPPSHETPEVQAWTQDELERFLAIAGEHRLGALFTFAAFSGLRRGEVAGLRWSDVEWADKPGVLPMVNVRHTRIEVGGTKQANVQDSTPKSRAGRRRFQLPTRAAEALMAWEGQQISERATLGGDAQHDYVFTDETGEPIRPDTITKTFERLVAQADVRRLTFHGLRHGWVTMMVQAGHPLALVSMWVGHSSYSFTLARYGHLTDDLSRASGGALHDADSATAYTIGRSGLHISAQASEKPQASRL